MARRAASLLLAAALGLTLCGCGGPAAESGTPSVSPSPSESSAPSPSPDPTPLPVPSVEVHWDALDQSGDTSPNPPRRLSDHWMDDLVPGDYGEVYPYIGGEQQVVYDYGEDETSYETRYLYGLCTAGGLLLTDPVFNSVYRLSWQDQVADESQSLPVWVVTRTLYDGDRADSEWSKGYYSAVGLLAADGSWYTGCRYGGGVSTTIAVGKHSALMMEDKDNAVLISLADGSELARYSPYDFIGPDDPNGVAEWLFADGLNWGMLRCYGDWFYCDPAMSGGAMEGDPIWIDGATGAFLEDPPMEVPEYQWSGKLTFDGGWYEDPAPDGELVLHYDDGTEETIPLDGSLGELSNASSQHLVFCLHHDEGDVDYILTDHSLNVLRRVASGDIWLYSDSVTGQQRPVTGTVVDDETWLYRYVLLDDGGNELVSSLSYLSINDGLFSAVDDTAYRFWDLNNGCREVFSLPRYAAMDDAD